MGGRCCKHFTPAVNTLHQTTAGGRFIVTRDKVCLFVCVGASRAGGREGGGASMYFLARKPANHQCAVKEAAPTGKPRACGNQLLQLQPTMRTGAWAAVTLKHTMVQYACRRRVSNTTDTSCSTRPSTSSANSPSDKVGFSFVSVLFQRVAPVRANSRSGVTAEVGR